MISWLRLYCGYVYQFYKQWALGIPSPSAVRDGSLNSQRFEVRSFLDNGSGDEVIAVFFNQCLLFCILLRKCICQLLQILYLQTWLRGISYQTIIGVLPLDLAGPWVEPPNPGAHPIYLQTLDTPLSVRGDCAEPLTVNVTQ